MTRWWYVTKPDIDISANCTSILAIPILQTLEIFWGALPFRVCEILGSSIVSSIAELSAFEPFSHSVSRQHPFSRYLWRFSPHEGSLAWKRILVRSVIFLYIYHYLVLYICYFATFSIVSRLQPMHRTFHFSSRLALLSCVSYVEPVKRNISWIELEVCYLFCCYSF